MPRTLGSSLAASVALVSIVLSVSMLWPTLGRALDKQGSAHGGGVGGDDEGVNVSGSLILGTAMYNPSYAARPDNSGIALMRYAAHLDVDLIGRRLSIPIDLNLFSDRQRSGAKKLSPSELDMISGVSSTWSAGPGAVEFGSRVEHDRSIDRAGKSQTYIDARARYLYSVAALLPGLRGALHGGDVSGWATLGWFAYNPSYFARPDNTGAALLRYAYHVELSMFDDLVSLGVDTTFFTDKHAKDPVRPSELDLTPELIVHLHAFEVHVAYERDMSIDRPGLVQQFVYALAVWSFVGLQHNKEPFEARGQVASP
ncbi:MAG: hypothetical protein JWN48_4614 [Myxococcaceae bacterium]|nr:hypothetical protein [Myxococcaceae bacterium]